MLIINSQIALADWEIQLSAIRAQGAGGQNVNKVSSAIHLRFDIVRSRLPDFCKQRLLSSGDSRISKEGVLILKAQRFRTQEQNRDDALERLKALIEQALVRQKRRLVTKPSRAAKARRADGKTLRGKIKTLRGKVDY